MELLPRDAVPWHLVGKGEEGLSITVFFSGWKATLAAIEKAVDLASQLGANIRVLIAEVVPYALPIECPRVDPQFRARAFQEFSSRKGVEVHLDIWLCRDRRECLQQALEPHSVVVIGGRKCPWPTRHGRLRRMLEHAGHHVISVAQH